MADDLQVVVHRVVGHLADVLAMTSGQAARALPAEGGSAVEWCVPLTITGTHDASLLVGIADAAAQRVVGIVLGADDAYGDADVADTLKEIIGQATAAYVNQESTGLTIGLGTPVRGMVTPPATAWQHDIVMEGADSPRVAVWLVSSGTPDAAQREPASPVPGAPVGPPVSSVAHRNLDVVLDLDLPITVRFGETRLTLETLARLGAGSVIDLDRAPDDPVDLLVNGRLVARGDVVVVAGCYGVRVREVVSAADRLRSLEG